MGVVRVCGWAVTQIGSRGQAQRSKHGSRPDQSGEGPRHAHIAYLVQLRRPLVGQEEEAAAPADPTGAHSSCSSCCKCEYGM